MAFKRAVKYDAKGRVALIGPAGSGKSYTMLILAQLLAGPSGKIAAIDTEHGSLSKYADLFEFDVEEPDSFSPDIFLSRLTVAEQEHYSVFCCDSLSHFWMGKEGALEYVDNAKSVAQSRARNGRVDDMIGWKEFRPHEREMVDRMIASPCHIICTMRVKTAYEEQIGNDGKKHRVKVGLAPVQREGLEYEFDLVGALNDDNSLIVDKTRCPYYSAKAIKQPGAKDFQPFADWLKGAKRDITPQPPGGSSARNQIATEAASGETDARQSAGPNREIPPSSALGPEVSGELQALYVRLGTSIKTILPTLAQLKSDIVELAGTDKPYYQILNRHEWKHADRETVKACNKIEVVRQIARELFEYAQKCRESLEFQATDDDLPEALQPKQANLIETEVSYSHD